MGYYFFRWTRPFEISSKAPRKCSILNKYVYNIIDVEAFAERDDTVSVFISAKNIYVSLNVEDHTRFKPTQKSYQTRAIVVQSDKFIQRL